MLRVLSISTLLPSPQRPAFGKFVGSQMRAVEALGTVDLVMINPLGVPPWPLCHAAPYAGHQTWPQRSQLGGLHIPDGAPLLVTPGSLIVIKGQTLAIGALAHLPNAHLALAGKGPDEAALHAQAKASGVADRVHFMGQVSHDVLPVLMAAADALVLPSEREGLANVWVEALSCGAPLVIPDIGGATEVVTDPTAGRIAAHDPLAIAEAVRDLLAHPVPQDAVAAHAARFSWQNNAERLVEIWRKAAGV